MTVGVQWLFLMVSWISLQCVIFVVLDPTQVLVQKRSRKLVHTDRNSRGSGVMLLVHKDIEHMPMTALDSNSGLVKV